MSVEKEQDFSDTLDIGTYGRGYMTLASVSAEENPPSLPDMYHHNFISLLSVAIQLQVDLLDITWQPALEKLGKGASSLVNQSDQISKDLTFAFKRSVPGCDEWGPNSAMSDQKRYRALLSEILVLGMPSIRDHPNIIRLEGIAWEFNEGKVWPMLVFPKANRGTLKEFINSKEGQEASFETLLRLCIDVAFGLHALHEVGIIHGDIKPTNILVSREDHGFSAIIADFDSSSICSTEDDLITLRRTPPWDAVEWHDRYFEVKDAKRTDIYSFGLVCFYTLNQGLLKSDIVEILPSIKDNDGTLALVDAILANLSDLSPEWNSSLAQFFRKTACADPAQRETNFEELLRLLSCDKDFKLRKDQIASSAAKQHDILAIVSAYPHMGKSDFRLRQHLETSLINTSDDISCSTCASEAAFALAIGWKIGFFINGSEAKIEDYVRKSGNSIEEFQARIKEISSDLHPSKPIPRAIRQYQVPWSLDVVQQYEIQGILAQAESVLEQEISKRSVILGPKHILVQSAKEGLADIMQSAFRLDEAQRLREEVLDSCDNSIEHTWGVLQSLAVIAGNQGRLADAEKLHSEAHAYIQSVCGEQNVITVESMATMASIYYGQGRYPKAVETLRIVVSALEAKFGPDHLRTLSANESLADSLTKLGSFAEAIAILDLSIDKKKRLIGGDHRETLKSKVKLAMIYSHMGDPEEAIRRLEDITKEQMERFGPKDYDTLESQSALAGCFTDIGKWKPALNIAEQVMMRRVETLGSGNPLTMRSKMKVGTLLGNLGEIDLAIDLISASVADRTALLGENHPDTITGKGVLSSAYRTKHRLKDAESLGSEVERKLRELYGPLHPDTLDAMESLAATYIAQGRMSEAAKLLTEAISISKGLSGEDSPKTLRLRSIYATTLAKDDEAESQYAAILEAMKAMSTNAPSDTVVSENNLANSIMKQGRWQDAESILRKILPISQETLGPTHRTTVAILGNLAICSMQQGSLEDAQDTFERIINVLEKNGENSAPALPRKADLASIYLRRGKVQDAITLNENVLDQMKSVFPDGHHEIMRVMNNLTAAYARTARLVDAQNMMRQLCEIAERKFGTDDPQTKAYQKTFEELKESN